MINTPINDKTFVELQIQGAQEFGETWYMMNQYIVSLAKSHKVDHVGFSMGLTRMALNALRNKQLNFNAKDFLNMVMHESEETPSLVGADA